MKLSSLDCRYNAFPVFKHLAKCESNEPELFLQIREWCWQQWGPSCEQNLIVHRKPKSLPVWAWDTNHGNLRILMLSDKEYQWFLLGWGDHIKR
jgi:hypothetical protein